jgi:hypothetical protein
MHEICHIRVRHCARQYGRSRVAVSVTDAVLGAVEKGGSVPAGLISVLTFPSTYVLGYLNVVALRLKLDWESRLICA